MKAIREVVSVPFMLIGIMFLDLGGSIVNRDREFINRVFAIIFR